MGGNYRKESKLQPMILVFQYSHQGDVSGDFLELLNEEDFYPGEVPAIPKT
jgi:hypothetical protein